MGTIAASTFRLRMYENRTVNWVPFATTGAYAMIVIVFFLACLTGFVSTSDTGNLTLYLGGIIMLGILPMMVASTSESKS